MDPEELSSRKRADVFGLIMKAADDLAAGARREHISLPEIHNALAWGRSVNRHAILWIVRVLEENGLIVRRWGPEMSEKAISGKKSFVLPTAKAFSSRSVAIAGII